MQQLRQAATTSVYRGAITTSRNLQAFRWYTVVPVYFKIFLSCGAYRPTGPTVVKS